MNGGLQLLQDRATLLLVRLAGCAVQGLHWMGAGAQQVKGPFIFDLVRVVAVNTDRFRPIGLLTLLG